MNRAVTTVVSNEVSGATFSFYTSEQIRKISVKQITEPDAFDIIGNCVSGGLYDAALGPFEPPDLCVTCGDHYLRCPGHFGHIELSLPVYNPVLFPTMIKIFQNTCLECHTFKHGKIVINEFIEELKVLYTGDVVKARDLRERHLTRRAAGQKKIDGLEDLRADDSDDDDNNNNHRAPMDVDKSGDDSEYKNYRVDEEIEGPIVNREKSQHFESMRRDILREFVKIASSATCRCANCGAFSPAIRNGEPSKSKMFIMPLGKEQFKSNKTNKKKTNFSSVSEESIHGTWYSPWELQRQLKKLFKKEKEVLDLLFGEVRPTGAVDPVTKKRVFGRESSIDSFFLTAFPVLPSRARPPNFMNNRRSESTMNNHYRGIVTHNRMITKLLDAKEDESAKSMVTNVCELQMHINNMYDNSKAQKTSRSVLAAGVKQILEKKEGLFRKHMMGKRVNYAARTVISPDISLETNEMGVPQYFARTLTFPQPVTHFNYQQMAQAVINGPDNYPGANYIEDEDGFYINLAKETHENRVALSKTLLTIKPTSPHGTTKKVYRHLLTGDFVLANRQPTLHKPGIMGHRVKVLGKQEKTLRMHYCNCSTYNADFDGDEMNIHFPQSFHAAAEIREIAANNFQYLGPRAGVPLRGLIQDHILTGVLLTKRDTLFTRAQFQAILYASLWGINRDHPIVTPQPAILKPVPQWTGKQLISAALNHLTIGRVPLTLESPSKIPTKLWGKHGLDVTRDSHVIIRQNEMVAGILDKGQFGASGNGLVHTCYEMYDPNTAGSLLTLLGRMFTFYLSTRGFTCSVEDLLINAKEEDYRRNELAKANEEGLDVAAKFVGQRKYDKLETARLMNVNLREEREVGRLDGMLKKALNQYTSKIIDTLIPGGQRKPFPENNFSLMTVSGAKGSVVNFSQVSCLLGQQELEGKRVPRMVSGKTLPAFEPFDPSARAGGFIMDRFLTGVRPQDYFFHCMAGREGLIDTAVKTARSGYLQRCIIKHLEGITVQYDNTVRDADGSVIQFNYGEDSLEITKRQYLTNFTVAAENYELLKSQFAYDELVPAMRNVKVSEYNDKLHTQLAEKKAGTLGKTAQLLDPVMAKFNPAADLGCVSEAFMTDLNKYIDANPQGLIQTAKNKKGKIPEKDFRNLMFLYYNRSMVSPGESVGLLCAQSIGEPSTQMTLNTFHLAGRGEANVTLGIPRLREIIMTASQNPSTPLMELQISDPTDKAATEAMAKKLEWLKMNDIIEGVSVVEYYTDRERHYDIKITFVANLEEIMQTKSISKDYMFKTLERFIKEVKSRAARSGKKTNAGADIGRGKKSKNSDDRDDEIDMGDDDSADKADDSSAADKNDDAADDQSSSSNGKKKSSKKPVSTVTMDTDSVDSKKKNNKTQKVSYDDDDENNNKNDEDDEDEEDEQEEKKKDEESEESQNEESEQEDDESEEEESEESDKSSNKKSSTSVKSNLSKFNPKKEFSFIVGVKSDSKKVLMLNIIEDVAFKFIIKSCKGISRCFINEKTVGGKTEYSIQTEGINLIELFEMQDHLQLNRMYTNDIGSILNRYGVEACKSAIVSEISNVFGAYGITVDKRHLTLLADYMTYDGGFRPLNRIGLENNTSPLQKMSFETTCAFLSKAALVSDSDFCESPSSRIVLGQVVRGGTGAFEIVAPLN
ncbi:RNA polymerase I [Cavenderia fasciculata]|uniref:DNA-directed RNA polymerase subunit n=1 Tax=Cavenderia fasciculata TaxID=261658 RepID=F4PXX7_CACFS|nr:RNA polymerase I [Cavenderia fasciculata]EGG19637.1 RNA polymerase I [Cavenderia fasciculata]|eukprot:XP_004357931.1 RNA polymerase I [Cavenderia fasciculata]